MRVVQAWTIPPLTATGVGMIPAYGLLETELGEAAAASIEEDLERVGVPGGVEIERSVVRGDAAGVLVDRSAGSDLLVVGSRGRGALAGAFLGSVSRACLHHAPGPVAVVHVAHHGERSRIVVGVDGSTGATAALEWAIAEARLRRTTVHAVSAYHEPWSLSGGAVTSPGALIELREGLAANAGQILEEARRSAPDDVPVSVEAAYSPAGQALVAAAADADLLVVGSRGRGGFKSLVLGSVSEYCAAHVGGTVVVVPPTG
jgi:nucleotide-binding universal stress UspA family protein